MLDRRFAVAPMMDWTDRHCRVFHRLMTARALLYTEMLTTGAILRGDRARLLGFDHSEHPVALQLGGSDPSDLAAAARIGEDFGYDEINLNVGCPSDRVKDGRFGACLMAEPALVARGVQAMKQAVGIPVTVKCRIGIDDQDPETALDELARSVVAAGADALIVHARKAWLNGLSPKENRDIPPLDYHRVYRLKAAMPHVPVIINGGIASLAEAKAHLEHVDGVMLGRAAYQEPWRLLPVDPELFGAAAPFAAMKDVFEAMMPYIERELAQGYAAAFDHAAFRRRVSWRAGGAGVPSSSRREWRQAGRRRQRLARCGRAGRTPRGSPDRRVVRPARDSGAFRAIRRLLSKPLWLFGHSRPPLPMVCRGMRADTGDSMKKFIAGSVAALALGVSCRSLPRIYPHIAMSKRLRRTLSPAGQGAIWAQMPAAVWTDRPTPMSIRTACPISTWGRSATPAPSAAAR